MKSFLILAMCVLALACNRNNNTDSNNAPKSDADEVESNIASLKNCKISQSEGVSQDEFKSYTTTADCEPCGDRWGCADFRDKVAAVVKSIDRLDHESLKKSVSNKFKSIKLALEPSLKHYEKSADDKLRLYNLEVKVSDQVREYGLESGFMVADDQTMIDSLEAILNLMETQEFKTLAKSGKVKRISFMKTLEGTPRISDMVLTIAYDELNGTAILEDFKKHSK